MHKAKKVFLLLWGLLETWVFSGSILGWSALHYMLKKQGVYSHLCNSVEVPPSNTTILVTSIYDDNDLASPTFQAALSASWGCVAQDKVLNLAYTIGIFCVGFSAFIWGFLIDRLGLRIIRLLLNSLITTGTVLLSVTTKVLSGKILGILVKWWIMDMEQTCATHTSFLIFPALTLMCLAGVPLRLANMQISNLFPKGRSTVITLYSGAFTASASIFIFAKYGYDSGLQWEWVCYVLVSLSCTMLPVTLFFLPVDKITDDNDEYKESIFKRVGDISIISKGVVGKFSNIPASPFSSRKSNDSISPMKDVSFIHKSIEKDDLKEIPCEEQLPFREALLSFSFTLHQYWFSWLLLATLNYAGSLNLWMERISSDTHTVSMYTQIYGLAQVSSLVLAPIAGIIMDYTLNVASQESDYEKRKLIKLRSGFWPMLFTTMAQGIVQLCKFFETEESVYVSIAFTTILRSFHVAVATAYLRIRFPASHFNRLLGIMSTTAAIITLLQFPLYVWESRSREDVFDVNVFCGVSLMICFVHPLHLLITPLQRYFIRRERRVTLEHLKEETSHK